jgi:acyl dehydratase
MSDAGWYFEDFEPGQEIVTMSRTITEADIVNFTTLGGIFEELFINAHHDANKVLHGRVAPAMLVLTYAEGLYVLTGHTRAGRAFLGLDQLRLVAPTRCGDSIRAVIRVESTRPSKSRPGHGVVVLRHRVLNQDGVELMTYQTTRLLECRPSAG